MNTKRKPTRPVRKPKIQIALHHVPKVGKALAQRCKQAAQRTLSALPARTLNIYCPKEIDAFTLSLVFVTRSQIQRYNRDYRGKDKPTDVLSFPTGPLPKGLVAPEAAELGDVLICPAQARPQAKDFGGTYAQELERLTVHGVLHLFGYDHETGARDAEKMFSLQEKILLANRLNRVHVRRPARRVKRA